MATDKVTIDNFIRYIYRPLKAELLYRRRLLYVILRATKEWVQPKSALAVPCLRCVTHSNITAIVRAKNELCYRF